MNETTVSRRRLMQMGLGAAASAGLAGSTNLAASSALAAPLGSPTSLADAPGQTLASSIGNRD
jgi:hypothetical protein